MENEHVITGWLLDDIEKRLPDPNVRTLIAAINLTFSDFPQYKQLRDTVAEAAEKKFSSHPKNRPLRCAALEPEPPIIITDAMRREAAELALLYDPPDD